MLKEAQLYTDGPWFEQPGYQANPRYLAMSEKEKAQLDRFTRDGFLVLDDLDVLQEVDLKRLQADVLAGYDPEAKRYQDAWQKSAPVLHIATHPQVLALLERLYGREAVPFQTLNFVNGTEQGTHSDFIHFNTLPYHFMAGVWVALEDITLKQGPLHYYLGSHRTPAVSYEKIGVRIPKNGLGWKDADVPLLYLEYEKAIADIARDFKREEFTVKKGQALIWASNLLHGGSEHIDKSISRWSQVTHYFFQDVIPMTPMFSKPSNNEWAVRNHIVDIKTGKGMRMSYNGQISLLLGTATGRSQAKPLNGEMWRMERADGYMARNPDVAQAVNGNALLAFSHYIQHGQMEGRVW